MVKYTQTIRRQTVFDNFAGFASKGLILTVFNISGKLQEIFALLQISFKKKTPEEKFSRKSMKPSGQSFHITLCKSYFGAS